MILSKMKLYNKHNSYLYKNQISYYLVVRSDCLYIADSFVDNFKMIEFRKKIIIYIENYIHCISI